MPRKRRTVPADTNFCVYHFRDGECVIVGEVETNQVSVCILSRTSPGGTLHFKGPARDMLHFFARGGRVAVRALRRRR